MQYQIMNEVNSKAAVRTGNKKFASSFAYRFVFHENKNGHRSGHDIGRKIAVKNCAGQCLVFRCQMGQKNSEGGSKESGYVDTDAGIGGKGLLGKGIPQYKIAAVTNQLRQMKACKEGCSFFSSGISR